jgi:hypothetical protein
LIHVSCEALLNQGWDPANSAKDSMWNRLWFIYQRGFEICVFNFDTQRYQYYLSPKDINFILVNLHNWVIVNLKFMNIDVETEIINGV